MTWLTSTWAFYGGFMAFLVLPKVIAAAFSAGSPAIRAPIPQLADDPRLMLRAIGDKLEHLLKSGYDRSTLIITFKGSELCVRFRKYIHAKGDYGMELVFPLAAWSEKFIPALRDQCAASGIASTVEPERAGDNQKFLYVDFGKDGDAARRMTEEIVTNVFAIPSGTPFDYAFTDVHPLGDAVYDPRQMPPSQREIENRQAKIYARSDAELIDALLEFAAGIPRYVAIVGLLHSLLWSTLWAVLDQTPDWGTVSLSLLQVTISPRIFDLVCFALLAVAVALEPTPATWQLRVAGHRQPRLAIIFRRAFGNVLLPAILLATIVLWFV